MSVTRRRFQIVMGHLLRTDHAVRPGVAIAADDRLAIDRVVYRIVRTSL
jgi:hypothetical protein